MNSRFNKILFVGGFLTGLFQISLSSLHAQSPVTLPPDRLNVFQSDTKIQKDLNKATQERSLKGSGSPSPVLDFQAGKIEVLKDQDQMSGSEGVIMSQQGVQVQADSGTVNTKTKDGVVKGNVVMATADTLISAEQGKINLDNETADLTETAFEMNPGGYAVEAGRTQKLSEFEYELNDSSFSTCKCADGARPWELLSDRCHITQEGYAHTYGSTLKFEGLPVLYVPWISFPVKIERASGLLAPTWGGTSRDGFRWRQPIFVVLDDSTDITLMPFIDTQSRRGSALSFREKFSQTSDIDSRFYYSDESPRGSDLRGLVTEGISDPTIDTNRWGGFYNHSWIPDADSGLPLQFVADTHFTSDNFFVREIQDPQIGLYNSQFLSSTALLRGVAFGRVNAEARAEYTQLLQTPQEAQPQRLPEINVSNTETFRPFGFNPYGVKIVADTALAATDFERDVGGAGWRYNARPRLTMPFHVSNYVRGQLAAEVNQTEYRLSDTTNFPVADGTPALPDLAASTNRTLPIFGFGLRSGVDRVYDLDQGNWLSEIVDSGVDNSRLRLQRLKHTIEPSVSYTYIPDVSQGQLPIFDSLDRYTQRSVISYGYTSRLYGRFLRPLERSRDIGELAPSNETLPMFDLSSSVVQFGRNAVLSPVSGVSLREGEIREIASFSMRQTYDYFQDTKEVQPLLNRFSDVLIAGTLSPSSYFTSMLSTNYSTYTGRFSSVSAGFGVRDDRNDAARIRYTFTDTTTNQVSGEVQSQLEGNIETVLSDRLKLGFYGRYDLEQSEFFESRGLIRFINSCKCWSVDLGYGHQLVPDNRQLLVTFTFTGLGDITQSIGLAQGNQPVAQP